MAGRIQQVAASLTAAVSGGVFAGAITPWLRFDYYTVPFNLALLVSQDNGGANTLALDYVVDDISNGAAHPVSLTQATTVITVTDWGPQIAYGAGLGHGLAVGDLVTLSGTQSGIDGTYSVASVTSASVYTLTAAGSQTLALTQAQVITGKAITAGSTGDKIIGSSGAGITTRTGLPVSTPILAARLRCTTFSASATARLVSVQGSLAA